MAKRHVNHKLKVVLKCLLLVRHINYQSDKKKARSRLCSTGSSVKFSASFQQNVCIKACSRLYKVEAQGHEECVYFKTQ